MKIPPPTRLASVLILLLIGTPLLAGSRTSPTHSSLQTPWDRAQHLRAQLETLPESARSRADYNRALDAYRALYHADPSDPHAPSSVYAVAELLTEQARSLRDPHSYQSAAAQYDFLRAQYPASPLVPAALLAEAQIQQHALEDPTAALHTYELLLKLHPHTEQAAAARVALRASIAEPRRERTPEHETRELVRQPATRYEATESRNAPRLTNASVHSDLPPMPTTAQLATRDTVPTAAKPRSQLPTAARIAEPISYTVPRAPVSPSPAATITGIRHWSTPSYTRVAIDLGDDVTYEATRIPHPDRLAFDLHHSHITTALMGKSFAVTDQGYLTRIHTLQLTPDTTRIVLDVSDIADYSAFLLPNPSRLIIDIHARTQPQAADQPTVPTLKPRVAQVRTPTPTIATPDPTDSADLTTQPGAVEATTRPTAKPIAARIHKPSEPGATPATPATPTAAGETSLVRALGLKINRIVIDAGHGGHDSGTIGAGGIQEKDVVLDVALRVGKLLHDRLGAQIIYTRSDDTFIPLETRTAIANKAQADLFLSIHANSSPDPSARGVETFYLNFTADPTALDVAARENAVSDQSIHQLSDLVKKITLKDKIEESREFAADVEQSLYSGLAQGNDGLKDRGVKKAPFVVLIGANMPSILAEISFVTNDRDADQLRRPDYRQRVAESLFQGVARYEQGLGDPRLPIMERASTRPTQTYTNP
jgi:N-acetylmuramoyl-L-alanine amidase